MKDYKMIRMMLFALCILLGVSTECIAQKTFGNVPPLHVDGKHFKDSHGNIVRLHGVMDTPNPYFNSYRWSSWNPDYSSSSVQTACINYFDKLFTAITDTTQGAYCNVFRLHLDPCWTNNSSVKYKYTDASGKTVTVGQTGDGEANIEHFDKSRLTTYMNKVFFKIAQKAIGHGLYVIMRPPGVCPKDIYVDGDYQHYLLDVWDIVSKNDSVRKYAGQISIELANEPVSVYNADGTQTDNTLHDFFQPIVDKIRSNGFTGIILSSGSGYQSSYEGYAKYPITGDNIGYAVHVYSGWYGQSDDNASGSKFITQFAKQVPVVKTAPIVVTEIDWSPQNTSGEIDHYNEFNQPVYKNYGTWATASTSKWGKAWREVHDYYGNIGMTLTSTDDYLDWNTYKNSNYKTVKPSFNANPECCAQACFDWYKEWNTDTRAYMNYSRQWTADQRNGKYKNPILNADFPDPDVIRVDDTFYMVSTTMFHFPGATILKSKDLVNWEYCANPLKQIANNDNYNLQNELNHYAQGQWASSLNYSNGKFYLYFIAYGKSGQDEGKNILLTTTNPEGTWDMQYWSEHYYDSGWLFDDGANGDGNVYVACGIGTITVNKLDGKTLKKISSKEVIKDYTINGQKCDGIEGSHMYHIGDYYYIYATTGGYFRGQQIFRSKDPMGPYEECPYMVFENQGIHQGALVDTPSGEWWTILFKDAGAIGRVPYLEPVTWKDGWPVVGKNGVDVSKNGAAYTKPNVGKTYPVTYLPTNDTFTDPEIGMQWGWNHNPDNTAWSLMENPGSLRLHTSGITTKGLLQARNSLTQRIWSYVPEGTTSAKTWDTYGTVKMNISHMQDGDVAGIAVFQDPYSLIGVKQVDGKRYLYSELTYVTKEDGTDKNELGKEIASDVIYLRAVVNFGTNKVKYYYSLDNKIYGKFGVEMDMRFMLSVFVGQRFYLFNYATASNGGYVDVDWFSTEPVYDESYYYGEGVLHTYTEADLTMSTLKVNKTTFKVSPGSTTPVEITCTYQSGLSTNVAANCDFVIDDPSVATIVGGVIKGIDVGTTNVTATYTDLKGNTQSVTFTVNVPDDITMTKLTMKNPNCAIIPKQTSTISIICTAASGAQYNVADQCTYTIADESIVKIVDGVATALKEEGSTEVTATYTDPRGNTQEVTFTVLITYFPLTEEGFNPNIWDKGSFSYSTTGKFATIKTAAYGFAGWKYAKGINLKNYKYLVIKLRTASTCSPSFRIFDSDNYWSDPYMKDIKSSKEAVIDLQNMTNSKGTKVDPSHIYIAGFWTTGGTVYLSDIFLSNDGKNPTDILPVFETPEPEGIYNLNGQRLSQPRKGINIINGKKVFVK